uniref:C2H2-type domain-containing protein n=1 Tax=Macrostomum lignano TaxID=282301 RepID=A0A1I8FHN9_9PLAT
PPCPELQCRSLNSGQPGCQKHFGQQHEAGGQLARTPESRAAAASDCKWNIPPPVLYMALTADLPRHSDQLLGQSRLELMSAVTFIDWQRGMPASRQCRMAQDSGLGCQAVHAQRKGLQVVWSFMAIVLTLPAIGLPVVHQTERPLAAEFTRGTLSSRSSTRPRSVWPGRRSPDKRGEEAEVAECRLCVAGGAATNRLCESAWFTLVCCGQKTVWSYRTHALTGWARRTCCSLLEHIAIDNAAQPIRIALFAGVPQEEPRRGGSHTVGNGMATARGATLAACCLPGLVHRRGAALPAALANTAAAEAGPPMDGVYAVRPHQQPLPAASVLRNRPRSVMSMFRALTLLLALVLREPSGGAVPHLERRPGGDVVRGLCRDCKPDAGKQRTRRGVDTLAAPGRPGQA